MKRILAFFMALLMLTLVVCSCKGNGGDNNVTGEVVEGADGAYVYPDLNFNGEKVTVSSLEPYPDSHMYFVPITDDTSEPVTAAVWESNKRLEEKYNFTLVEDKAPLAAESWEARWINWGNDLVRNFNSGDDVYDFVYYCVAMRPDLISSGYLLDLKEFEQIQFDQPWWDKNLNEDITINDRLYMASGSFNLMPYEQVAGLVFNKDILDANQIEYPYEMVRNGTWTLDAMYEIAAACKNIGVDPNWGVPHGQGGTSVYGTGIHQDYPAYFLTSAGISFLAENNGEYDLAIGSTDDFYETVEKIIPFFTPCSADGVGGGDAYSQMFYLFPEGRVTFAMNNPMDAFGVMRDSDVNFGFLPVPKLRVEQEDYITSLYDHVSFLCLPSTSEDPERIASLLDVMAYDRYTNVVPVYYDSFVTYKGVRDDDSIEMLEIMKQTRTIDPGIAYGLCYDLVVLKVGRGIRYNNAASLIAGNEDSVNEYIDDFISDCFD